MADPKRRLPGNVTGDFFVDDTCIDCDLCRQIAPEVFEASGETSVVTRQPVNPSTVRRAEMALVTCPTASIGTGTKHDLEAAVASYPESVDGGVHFCGFASESSYGASGYLVVRSGGNVLVDSPRFSEPLARRIWELGGVRWMFLTHRDDVADHAKFRKRFGCDRIIHSRDATFAGERVIEGDAEVTLDPDLLIIPTPGHTAGHMVLLHARRHLFTGDHLWWSRPRGSLWASRDYCWHSWGKQLESLRRLLDYEFDWILPGHGARHHAPAAEMRGRIKELLVKLGAAPRG